MPSQIYLHYCVMFIEQTIVIVKKKQCGATPPVPFQLHRTDDVDGRRFSPSILDRTWYNISWRCSDRISVFSSLGKSKTTENYMDVKRECVLNLSVCCIVELTHARIHANTHHCTHVRIPQTLYNFWNVYYRRSERGCVSEFLCVREKRRTYSTFSTAHKPLPPPRNVRFGDKNEYLFGK